MKPVINRELEAIRKLIQDLENRLKSETVQLGHRAVFTIDRKGEVPAPTRADAGKILSVEGWVTGGGGSGTPDGHTLASVTGVLNAEPLSGTIDARFKDLSGSLSGKFATIGTGTPDGSTLASVTGVLNALPLSGTINAAFLRLWSTGGSPRPGDVSGSIDGHFNALSGTINNAIVALSGAVNTTIVTVLSASQAWSQTAVGTEGTMLGATLPQPFGDANYYAFVMNYSGTYSPVFKVVNKTPTGFQVYSTAPFIAGDKLDFIALSASLGPVADGQAIASLSGTINARFIDLSGSIDAAIAAAGGGGFTFSDVKFHPAADPASPDSLDDEFNGSSLDAKWVSFGGAGAISNTVANSSVVIAKTYVSDTVYGYSQAYAPAAAAFTVEARLNMARVTIGATVYSSAGIGVTDGTRYAFGGIMSDGGNVRVGIQYWSTSTVFVNDSKSALALPSHGVVITNGFQYPHDLWVRLARSGNDLIVTYSPNGYDFGLSTTYVNVLSGWGSITRIGMMGQAAGGGTSTIWPRYLYFRKVA